MLNVSHPPAPHAKRARPTDFHLERGLLAKVSPHEVRLALRINDAAIMLGISRTSVYELIAEGKLKSALIAGRRVIALSEFHRLVAESMT